MNVHEKWGSKSVIREFLCFMPFPQNRINQCYTYYAFRQISRVLLVKNSDRLQHFKRTHQPWAHLPNTVFLNNLRLLFSMKIIFRSPSIWCPTSWVKLSPPHYLQLWHVKPPLIFHEVMAHDVRNQVDEILLITTPRKTNWLQWSIGEMDSHSREYSNPSPQWITSIRNSNSKEYHFIQNI